MSAGLEGVVLGAVFFRLFLGQIIFTGARGFRTFSGDRASVSSLFFNVASFFAVGKGFGGFENGYSLSVLHAGCIRIETAQKR